MNGVQESEQKSNVSSKQTREPTERIVCKMDIINSLFKQTKEQEKAAHRNNAYDVQPNVEPGQREQTTINEQKKRTFTGLPEARI